jgi:hypothetical protein
VQKVKWAIEMNEARQLYLASYGRIDTIDSLIKNCNMFYVSWKYWHHASKLHVQALAVVVAYDMYKEIVEEAWAEFGFKTKQEAVKKCMLDFHAFRDQLAMQGLRYNSEDKKYKGDMAMRVNTKRKKAPLKVGERRAVGWPRKNVTPEGNDDEGVLVAAGGAQVTLAQFNQLKKPITGRLCGNLDKYMFHRQNIETIKHTGSLASSVVVSTATRGARFLDWPPTTTHKEVSILEMTALPSCTMITSLGWLSQIARLQKLRRTSVECQQAMTEKKNSHHIQDIQRVLPYALHRRAPTS